MSVINLARDINAQTANNRQHLDMYGIKKIILMTFLVLLWGFAATALQCLECRDMPSPEDCRIVTTCSSNSQCFVEQVVTSGGSILYNSGCLSTSRCELFGRKRQETVSETDKATCVHCCKGDFCNIGGCGVLAKTQPERPPLCFSCANQVDPNSCRDVTLCDQNQMCALTKTVIYNSHQWRSECASSLQCQALGHLAVGNGHCYRCCQDDFCNNNCNQQITNTTALLTTTPSQSSSVTFFTPTKLTTSTLSATVSNSNPSKQTHSIEVTIINASTVNKSTTTSLTSPQKLTVTSTTTMYSQPTTEVIPSATSAHTNPSSTLSKPPTSGLNNTSISPGILVSKQMSSLARSTFSDTSTTISSSKATTVTLGTITTTSTPNISDSCTNRKVDICFVIDSSESLGKSGFMKVLDFVSEVVRHIAMETNSTTNVCVVRSSSDHVVFALKLLQFNSTDSIINSIAAIHYRTGERNISAGLLKAVHELRHNGRQHVEKDIILITDGKSNYSDWSLHDRHHMEKLGIDLYAVGIGTQTNSSELQTVVTDNNHLLEVPDPDHLDNLYVNTVLAICRDNTSSNAFLISSTTTMSPSTKPMDKYTSLTLKTIYQTKSVNSAITTSLPSSAGTIQNNKNVTSLNPKTDFPTTVVTEKNVTNINISLQTSTTIHSPASAQMDKNTSLTTASFNYTRSVNSTVAAHLTSSANSIVGTTTNILNVTSVDPQTTEETVYTGSKHQFTTLANSSKNITVTDVFLQTSSTSASTTTQTTEITSPTTLSLNRTKSVNSTVATGLTSPASNDTGITKTNMNATSVAPNTGFLTTVTTGFSGYTISANSISLNQTGSVFSTSATALTSPARNGTGTTMMNMNVTSSEPLPTITTTTKTTTTGVTGSKHPVTLPAISIACAVCSGPEFLCEKLYAIQQCNPPNNYCINKLHNHIDGSRIVTRQCGSFETCYRDWYLGSSDSDKCRKFDESSILTLDFTCTYCCINDNCNKPIRPAVASLYIDE